MKTNLLIIKLLLLLICAIFLFVRCSNPEAIVFRKTFENKNWAYADSFQFDFNNLDTLKTHEIKLNLGIDNNYPYNNLYLLIRMESPSGKDTKVTNQLLLADSTGGWNAQKDWNGVYTFNTTLNNKARFTQPGKYRFIIKQYMRKDILEGIRLLEIQIAENK